MDSDISFFKKYLASVIPSTMALLMSALYNVADTFFVARGTGVSGVAGVGLAVPFMMIVIAISQTMGTGCSIVNSVRMTALGILFWPAYIITGGYFLSDRKPLISSLLNAARSLLFLYPCLFTMHLWMSRFDSLWTGSVLADGLIAGVILLIRTFSKRQDKNFVIN